MEKRITFVVLSRRTMSSYKLSKEDAKKLEKVAIRLVGNNRGILAADESPGSMKSRLAKAEVENTPENRRKYREVLFSCGKRLSKYISGVILHMETACQKDCEGVPFVKVLKKDGIIPGIKLDLGLRKLLGPVGEPFTKGLDDLAERCVMFRKLGCKFVKWRSVFEIGETTPSRLSMEANLSNMAAYAAICQWCGLVPIVEPEVLSDGDHDINKASEVTARVLKELFRALDKYNVHLPGILLKSSMAVPGRESDPASPKEVAEATLDVFKQSVPASVPGIVFLSGGQAEEEATVNLNEINKIPDLCWCISFSYGRALQTSALIAWNGENDTLAQKALLDRAKALSQACGGTYEPGSVKSLE